MAKFGKGVLMLGAEIVPWVAISSAFEDNVEFLGESIDTDEDDAFGGFMALVLVGNKIWSMTDTYKTTKKINRDRGRTSRVVFQPIKSGNRQGIMLSYKF